VRLIGSVADQRGSGSANGSKRILYVDRRDDICAQTIVVQRQRRICRDRGALSEPQAQAGRRVEDTQPATPACCGKVYSVYTPTTSDRQELIRAASFPHVESILTWESDRHSLGSETAESLLIDA